MLCGSLHDALGSPVVDPRCLGGSVDRCAVTASREHGDHNLNGLCCHAGFEDSRRKRFKVRVIGLRGCMYPASPMPFGSLRCGGVGQSACCSRRWRMMSSGFIVAGASPNSFASFCSSAAS
jgi:hypothetical protein